MAYLKRLPDLKAIRAAAQAEGAIFETPARGSAELMRFRIGAARGTISIKRGNRGVTLLGEAIRIHDELRKQQEKAKRNGQ